MLDVAPIQPALQRSIGRGEVCFGARGLNHLYQQGCAKILLPKTYGDVPEAVIVNTAGGLTGGDVFEVSCAAEEGASLCVSSQTAERVYRADSGVARVVNELNVGVGSHFDWLPQETILYEGSGLARQLNVQLAGDTQFLAIESVVLGRKASGETLARCKLNDQWRIWRDGKLVYADGLRFGPNVGGVFERQVIFGGARAFATLIYVAPDAQDRLALARSLLKEVQAKAVASAWNSMLVVRFLAEDSQNLRESLIMYLQEFRGQTMSRVWNM